MITGGNSGIGFATASKLAASGFHVILASRIQQKSKEAIVRICAAIPEESYDQAKAQQLWERSMAWCGLK